MNGDELAILLEPSTETRIWLTQVFLVVLATVTVNFILMRVIDLIEHLAGKTENLWDDALLDAARVPIRLVLWVVGISIAIEIMEAAAPSAIFEYLPEARRVAFVFILALFCTRIIRNVEENVVDPSRMRKPMDQTTARAISKLLRLSVIITAVLVLMQTLGYSISGVLAFGGVGGIAIGFAAKDLLANFFGGMMIYLDKPFVVGDWVRSPDRQIEGTVEDIGWRLTRIRTFDKRPLYIPNSMFASIVVENPSRMLNRRINEKLGIRYEDWDKMEAICRDVREMLEQHEEIDTRQTLMVNFDSYGDSALQFFIYTFTKTTEWARYHQIKQDVLLKIMAIVDGHGAEFAFPTRTLHLQSALAQMPPDQNATPEERTA